ncbi:MAG: alpha-amylase family glycosyl hydrolase, partial [Elusimicrobiota bacterium]
MKRGPVGGRWYQNAVFYELRVRSFADGNGDGVGDFKGLISRLGYLKGLGVDCLWLLPIHPSPLKDDGYDVADYYSVHPDYGTLVDFKAFLREAHRLGLRVILDLGLNHT